MKRRERAGDPSGGGVEAEADMTSELAKSRRTRGPSKTSVRVTSMMWQVMRLSAEWYEAPRGGTWLIGDAKGPGQGGRVDDVAGGAVQEAPRGGTGGAAERRRN